MLLKKLDRVSQVGEALDSLILDLGDITQVGHHLGQELLIVIRIQIFGDHLDTSLDFVHEVLDVSHLLSGVVVEEGGEAVDPVVDDGLKLLD